MFDDVVLDVICKQIDDPTTYFNFSILNKKCHKIAMLHQDDKLTSFSKLVQEDIEDLMIVMNRVLPDGTLHGIQNHMRKTYYHFGIEVAEILSARNEVWIMVCDCSKGLTIKEIKKKLVPETYKLVYQSNKGKCGACNSGTKVEHWGKQD